MQHILNKMRIYWTVLQQKSWILPSLLNKLKKPKILNHFFGLLPMRNGWLSSFMVNMSLWCIATKRASTERGHTVVELRWNETLFLLRSWMERSTFFKLDSISEISLACWSFTVLSLTFNPSISDLSLDRVSANFECFTASNLAARSRFSSSNRTNFSSFSRRKSWRFKASFWLSLDSDLGCFFLGTSLATFPAELRIWKCFWMTGMTSTLALCRATSKAVLPWNKGL